MAAGKPGPKPYRLVRSSTAFLRVPVTDWPAVKRGIKTEFRAASFDQRKTLPWTLVLPTPVVAYSVGRTEDNAHDAQLMVCERAWFEPLGAISPESLAREGFASLAEFRRYWMRRERKRFSPLRKVVCYRVRPWRDGDDEFFARLLLERLYGEFLPSGRQLDSEVDVDEAA